MAKILATLNEEEMNEAELEAREWARIREEEQNDIYDNPAEREDED